jgi:3,4-dihydroxy 2-butanone 4-phosphate synthase/GTP cyclohydrolase II
MMSKGAEFCTIPEAVADLRDGRMIILLDDECRENEGDLVIAAEKATPESINFMMRHGCGLVCLAMSPSICDRLGLEPLPGRNADPLATPFTPSIDARRGVTTGVSAFDRARTVQVVIAGDSTAADLTTGKGHVPGLRARDGGVLVRAGHTEGSTDLARLAGLKEAAVICEIVKENGTMARLPDLQDFSRQHKLKMCTIAQLIKHRRQHEKLVRRELQLKMPSAYGDFDLIAYRSILDLEPHLALCTSGLAGELECRPSAQSDPVLVRIHSECLTGDIFHSRLCDCGAQFRQAMSQIQEVGKGILLYMRQEGRGIGLLSKLQAYQLQQKEDLDTVEANLRLGFKSDLRNYDISAQILADLGVRKVRLLTNNPKKVADLEEYGLNVVERVPLQVVPNDANRRYLRTKKEKLGHLMVETEFDTRSELADSFLPGV